MLQGGLFDYDGTLADTKQRQFYWMHHWAKYNNKDIRDPATGDLLDNPERFFRVYNEIINKKGIQAVYDTWGLPCDMNDMNHLVWKMYEDFKLKNPVKLYNGIKEAITEIFEMGHLRADAEAFRRLRLGINTTNSWPSIQNELKHAGIIYCFDAKVTAEDLNNYLGEGKPGAINKPSKVSVALSLDALGTKGHATFHVGDTLADLKASIDVRQGTKPYLGENLITIGAAWGYEGRTALEKGWKTESGTTHFRHIADSPSELPGIIEQYVTSSAALKGGVSRD